MNLAILSQVLSKLPKKTLIKKYCKIKLIKVTPFYLKKIFKIKKIWCGEKKIKIKFQLLKTSRNLMKKKKFPKFKIKIIIK